MHFWDQHRTITKYYEIRMKEVCSKYNLRQLEYDILLFLHNNPQYKTASDIVRARKSAKSHVSTSLDVLEKRGFYASKHTNSDNLGYMDKGTEAGSTPTTWTTRETGKRVPACLMLKD